MSSEEEYEHSSPDLEIDNFDQWLNVDDWLEQSIFFDFNLNIFG